MSNTRTIVQIQALRFEGMADERLGSLQETELVALCDDGSLWSRIGITNSEWLRIDDVPQT